MSHIRFSLLSLFSLLLSLSLTGCDSQPDKYKVIAEQGLCDQGFDKWDQPTCKGPMKQAGSIEFILYPHESRATATQLKPNPYQQATLMNVLTDCQIEDAKNWSCNEQQQNFYIVKNGHFHHYTLNKDLTLTHFIGQVSEPKTK